MENKNGFTLIEIIVTIGIMAVIGLVISTNMIGLFSSEEDKEYEAFIKRIEEAACTYVETNWDSNKRSSCKSSNCTVTINELIQSGLVEENLKDPNTKELVSNSTKYNVSVSWEDNVKTCKIKN